MKSILLIALIGISFGTFANSHENEPVLLKKIGAWTTGSLIYPKKAIEERIEGIVYVSFEVSENLNTTNIVIEEGVSVELDKKASEIVKNLKVDSIRFKLGGKYILPVKFVIK